MLSEEVEAPGGGEGAIVVDLNSERELCGWLAGADNGISAFCLVLWSFIAAAFPHSGVEMTSFFSCARELGVWGSRCDMAGIGDK